MNTNKDFLRDKYRKLREELTPESTVEKSLLIANQLVSLPIWENQYFHVYLPIVSKKEVDTEYILHILAGKDKEIVISKSDFSTHQMTHFLLTDSTKITTNKHGIPEPQNGLEVPVSKIDVVFVPLMAYDNRGHRVGYGKGFYDRFLAECRNETIKIGLSFFAPESELMDILESDVQLDYCVTPEKIFKF